MRKVLILMGVFVIAGLAWLAWNSLKTDFHDDSAESIMIDGSSDKPDANPSLTEGVPPPLSDILKVSDIDFGAYDKNMARFIGLEVGMPMAEAETKVLEYFTTDAGGKGNPVFEMDKLQGYVGGQAFIATIDRMNDDSVKAQQLYAIGKKDKNDTFTLVDYGLRVKCWRGDNKDNWQTDLCP